MNGAIQKASFQTMRKAAPTAVLRVHCIFGKGGVREWGADPDKYYYILQILHIESIENWKGGNV